MGRDKAAPRQQASAQAAAPAAFAPQWVTWVEGVTYLTENMYDKRIPKEVVCKHRRGRTLLARLFTTRTILSQ